MDCSLYIVCPNESLGAKCRELFNALREGEGDGVEVKAGTVYAEARTGDVIGRRSRRTPLSEKLVYSGSSRAGMASFADHGFRLIGILVLMKALCLGLRSLACFF